MSSPADSKSTNSVSKVRICPLTDAAGKTEALVVTIKTVEASDEQIRTMEATKRIASTETKRTQSADSKRKSRTSRSFSDKLSTKSNTDDPRVIPQTSAEMNNPETSATMPNTDVLCLKHAAENISHKASDMPSEKVSMCSSCSKSMLSYIFVVQDFLESLAKEIVGDANSSNCVQCMRKENRLSLMSSKENIADSAEKQYSKKHEKHSEIGGSLRHVKDSAHKSPTLNKSSHQDQGKNIEDSKDMNKRTASQKHQASGDQKSTVHSTYQHKNFSEPDFSAPQEYHSGNKYESLPQDDRERYNSNSDALQSSHHHPSPTSNEQPQDRESHHSNVPTRHEGQDHPQRQQHLHHEDASSHSMFLRPMERQQPNFEDNLYSENTNPGGVRSVSSPMSEEVDGIVTTLSNMEREEYDSARDRAGWEGLSEATHERAGGSSSSSEAYVTMCRNNAEAMGCLVVGASLLLTRTSRTLCVLVSDGVSAAFRAPLSSVFHVVQGVRQLDSLGSTKLALLEQPELGISFEKLNVWRLVQFDKCVFLNADTLVISNCDELFDRPELSAVPDVGWPDCFNSGVFVFRPSQDTFWKLMEFAERQGSYDGGDQGLLNTYFNSWSSDISRKLSFVYNLMANVSYTYSPAFKQFGRNVKVVQFQGTFKPWHVKFFSRTGQISPASTVHPTYLQFVHIWINIFRVSALRQLAQDIQLYAMSQEVICAVELLRFFPLPTESEAEFYLTPPSVRLRLVEKKLERPLRTSAAEVSRRKSAEFLRHRQETESSTVPKENTNLVPQEDSNNEMPSLEDIKSTAQQLYGEDGKSARLNTEEDSGKPAVPKDLTDKEDVLEADGAGAESENALPGAEVGNYMGMKAWEQGRMDYQGSDSSENVIKRLQFLMSQPK